MSTFIIGYGSLMNRKSLNRTLKDVKEIDIVYLNNYERSWNAIENVTATFSTTYLGINKKINSKVNAIIFEVQESYLELLDKREFLYTREIVDYEDIKLINNTLNITKNDSIWIYVTNDNKKPMAKAPIIQSYVDTCLEGCINLEIEFNIKNFAIDFLLNTKNWSNFWVNDRIFPRAPHLKQEYAYFIDSLLNEHLNEYFKNIEIE